MIRSKFIVFYLLLISFAGNSIAQNLAIGEWRAHLPFNKARLVTEGNNNIICGAEDGLFIYSKLDNSLETVTKINQLSDINLSMLRYNSSKDLLFVGYDNGNIDLMQGNTVSNLPDIKRKNIIGSKRINNLMFFGKHAYLACGFGLVVLDLDKKEIKDTYYLTSSGTNNTVHGVTTDGVNIYAASDSGIFRANISDPNINFFGSWTDLTGVPPTNIIFNHIFWFNNKLYAHYDANGGDNIWVYENGIWNNTFIGFSELWSVQITNNKLVCTGNDEVKVYDLSLQPYKTIKNTAELLFMRDGIIDASGIIWIADNKRGLVKATSNTSLEYIVPVGPTSGKVTTMQIINQQLWVGHSGPRGNRWDPKFSDDGFSTFVDNNWTTYDRTNTFSNLVSLDTVKDFMALAIDPRNSNHLFLGSRGKGIIEFEKGGGIKNYFSSHNSTIQTIPCCPGTFWMGGMAFDTDYNLWMVNSNVPFSLLNYKTDGTWQKFSFPGIPTTDKLIGDLMIDSYGQIWINFLQNGIIVYDQRNTGNSKQLTDAGGKGGLCSMDVRTFAEDREGQVWVGTSKGVCVFYSPSSIFSGSNFDAQKILLLQEGSYQYLLETEAVNAIAVDGANFKWFGTENSGVFYVSPDLDVFVHFTAENSPLLSNYITSIAIDHKSGEVFIGTDRGIVSMRGKATEGGEQCENTYVFPNPVYPDYEGIITITGLINNGNVKISDISGTLVFETTALGGQAYWNGKNFNGEKAHTGVYLIFCSDVDGENTCITKLLLVN